MPNKYIRKTNRGEASIEIYELAAEEVNLRGKSLRNAATSYDLNYSSLYRFIKKKKIHHENGDQRDVRMGYVPNFIFTPSEENILCDYLLRCSAANYGLSRKEARRLAYQLAKEYDKKFPPSWKKNEMAGEVWLKLFMGRHPTLSLRTPQATSLARATSFNKDNVKLFFDNYTRLLDKYKFQPADIWNMDESGVTTVQTPNRVIARKGAKQVSAMTSAERGTLVTLALAVNAIGNYLPPMFVFPRKRFKSHFIRDGPVGSVGTGNSSGWMQEDEFYTFLQHFKNHVRPSTTEHIVLLILDNHKSHIAVKNIQFCKENGIVLLTFPPHCTHKLQPLDRSVFGPIKKAINASCDSWMRSNAAKTMTIYDIPGIVKTSVEIAVTGKNITSGFVVTGIWPLNTNIFTEEDFLPSQVTDRPLDNNLQQNTSAVIEDENNDVLPNSAQRFSETNNPIRATFIDSDNGPTASTSGCASEEPIASTSRASQESTASISAENDTAKVFSPHVIRPLPKALPRKRTQNRRKVKSAVLTDTPEKEALEAIEAKRNLKDAKRQVFHKGEQKKKGKKKKKQAKRTKCSKSDSDDEDDDECICLCCLEPYKNSRPNEKWVQCLECKGWSHEECTTGELNYVCQNCLSD
jgi:hypothetical protein